LGNGFAMKLQQILKDSNYKLMPFSQEMIEALENQVIEKENKGKAYVFCLN
jgi:hypothetical protein